MSFAGDAAQTEIGIRIALGRNRRLCHWWLCCGSHCDDFLAGTAIALPCVAALGRRWSRSCSD